MYIRQYVLEYEVCLISFTFTIRKMIFKNLNDEMTPLHFKALGDFHFQSEVWSMLSLFDTVVHHRKKLVSAQVWCDESV
jgi:hypothetical protein